MKINQHGLERAKEVYQRHIGNSDLLTETKILDHISRGVMIYDDFSQQSERNLETLKNQFLDISEREKKLGNMDDSMLMYEIGLFFIGRILCMSFHYD